MRNLWTRALMLGAIGLAAGSSAGCAEERPPVNRVQANALAKSFFVGADLAATTDDPEFYFQTTLVDVGYGASQDGLFTSTYAQPMSRIKWQVTEDFLIARVTYERINDSDGKGAGPSSNDGVIAAVYRIDSHFDIRRDYNQATGEESNVVVENSSDRPWNQREYFRVNWGSNQATDSYDFDTLSLVGLYGGITYEPLEYYVNDPQDPDAPHFDPDMGYFDVTNKAFAKPGLVDLSAFGWGIDTFPACYLDADIAGGTAPAGSCNPIELTLRQSFRKVVDNDFEAKEWDGFRFQAFGAFYEERMGYARSYGIVDQEWHRMIDRYNVWERSHYYKDAAAMTGAIQCYVPPDECVGAGCIGTPYGSNPNRDDNADGTADECVGAGAGSQCDTFAQKCTLPYQKRTPKPIVWYYTADSNQDYFEGTAWASNEWDVAMRSAVTTAQYAECQRLGGADCGGKFPILRHQQDSNWDLIQLAQEVDDCRHGLPGADGKPVYGGTKCESVAEKIGAERGYDADVIALAKQDEMVVLCHSPVEAKDPELCAPADKRLPEGLTATQCYVAKKSGDQATIDTCNNALTVRIGDLRYNQVNAVTAPQTPSPWGIMVDSEDPLTGEKIASSINIWTHVNDLFSQGIVDTARYIKGELKTDQITDGKYIKDWATAAEAAGSRGAIGQITQSDVRSRISAVSGKEIDVDVDQGADPGDLAKIPDLNVKLKQVNDLVKSIRSDVSAPSSNAPMYAARLRALAGTDIEAELMTKMVQQLGGVEGLPAEVGMKLASPVRGANRSFQRQFERMKENALGKRGACILKAEDAMNQAPLSIADLADVLEAKFGVFEPQSTDAAAQQVRAERMRKYVAQRAHYAVIIHEMGHSIALRHNFVSSSDAFNYRSQYWQLRTKNGTVNEVCKDVSTDGENCIGPRYFDPITKNEKKNLMWMFMSSSVMDYAGEVTQDLIGLGAYDFAAARIFYGDAVAVYQNDDYKALTPRGRGVIEKMDNFGGLLGFDPQIGNKTGMNPGTDTTSIHYSQLQNEYALVTECADVGTAEEVTAKFKPASWNEARDGAWHPVLDGLIVSTDGTMYSRCKQQPVDFVQWDALRKPNQGEANKPGSEAGTFYRGGPSVDANLRTRVPYGFATDRWADLGNSAVYRHDNGADIYELFDFFITQQEVGHIFDNYRRGRKSFSIRGAANRALERYNEKMRDSAKGVGLLVNIYKDFGVEIGVNQKDMVDYALKQFFPTNALASGIAFDHFGRMMSRPEIGDHLTVGSDPVLRSRDKFYSVAASDKAKIIVPNGASGFYGNISPGGMLLENTLADNQGEYDSEYTMNVGSYYGKMYTTMLLTESEDNFISDSITDFSDARYRSISIADVFTEGYRRWLANNLTGDDMIKGVRVAAKANGTPDVGPDLFPAKPLGTTSWWPSAGPEVCFPNVENIVCSQYGATTSAPFNPQAVPNVAVLDPLIGWEQQKFLITWTYVYLPENQKRYWLDRLELKELGKDSDPGWASRVELHIPDGSTYVARAFGTETIFGKTVQKGVAARVLEYANELVAASYQGKWHTSAGEAVDQADPPAGAWFIADIDAADGLPIVKFDPDAIPLNANGGGLTNGKPGCSKTVGDNLDCICEGNTSCIKLDAYKTLPWFLARMDNWIHVGAKALYPEAL